MKIGEFARRNNITHDTIRHYIDMGLLVVEKQGSQYHFTEEDSGAIEQIVMLKQLDFSLTEIQEILCFYRLEGEKSDDFRSFYLSHLERKQEQVRQEQQKMKEIDYHLKNKINELKLEDNRNLRRLGFPISSLALLHCPYCKNALGISGGSIANNMILEAAIECKCGYTAVIEDGIFIDTNAAGRAGRKKEMPTKHEFLEVASPKYINFIYNGTTTLIDYMQNYGNTPKYIMELDNCAGRFLMQYIDDLPSSSTYILICHDKERIANLKNNLMIQHEHSNYIFFCCEIDQLPIVHSSIDIIIDHWMSKNYAKSAQKFLLDIVSPLLKPEGLLIGAYPHLGTKCRDFMDIPLELRDQFNRNKILERLAELNYSPVDTVDLGPIIEDNPYIDIKNKEQYLTLYVGRKKSNFELISSGAQHVHIQNMIS